MIIRNILGLNKIKRPWKKYYDKSNYHFDIPEDTMYDIIKKNSVIFSDYPAYEYFGKKVKYRKFIKQIDKCALAFNSLGIKKGDIVTICMPNTPEALICLYALNKLGALAHMVHPLSAEEEIKSSVLDTNTKILIIIDMCYEKIEKIISEMKLKKIVFVSAADSMPFYLKIGYNLTKKKEYKAYPKTSLLISWKEFLLYSRKSKKLKELTLGKNTPAVILHSGGTSGTPKYVVHANRSFTSSAEQARIVLSVIPGDKVLTIMPNFHGFGLSVCMHIPLTLGVCVCLIPQFDAKKFDVLINKIKPAVILGVPTLYEALISNQNVKNIDLSCLKYMICGGDTLSKSLEERINNYLDENNANICITQGYGLTEALAAICICHDDINKSGSIGIPLPRNDIKIIDPTTRKTNPYGTPGEICVSGPSVMLGYLNNEQESNTVLQVHDDNRVWLHTGDMGYMDKDGFIFYEQRIKRMIISSGYNVYPSHIEDVVESHPDVLQCSVVAMPHPYKQEVPKAFIVLKDGVKASIMKKMEIKNYCKKNLAHYMCPYKYVFRKKIPYTKLGKVDFKTLQKDEGEDDV